MLPTSSKELNKLRSLIEDKIQHDYLDNIIKKPAIDEMKLGLLYTIMKQSKLPESKKEQYILSTIFVQMALDTHQTVPIKNDGDESSLKQKSRQLTVLAGDYYSGLFYSLLSDTEDFPVIHILATAIKEINEYKMRFYYNGIGTIDEAINLLMKIESLLVSRILSHVNAIPDPAIIENIIILNALLRERNLVINNDSSSLLENLAISLGSEQNLLDKLEPIIDEKIKFIEEFIAMIPKQFNTLKENITMIFQDLLENNTFIAKEG